jgi:hypothetical protein
MLYNSLEGSICQITRRLIPEDGNFKRIVIVTLGCVNEREKEKKYMRGKRGRGKNRRPR